MTQTPTPKGDEEQEMTVTFQDRNTLRASFEKILGADPVCGGRVSSSTVERLVDAAGAGQNRDAIRAEAFREAAAVAKSRAAELRTIWGRQAAHLHENDAEMVARELDRQAKAILALAAAPQKGEG